MQALLALGLAACAAAALAGRNRPGGIVIGSGGAPGERPGLWSPAEQEELSQPPPRVGTRQWTVLMHVDFEGADVQQMRADDLAAVRQVVEEHNWTGFSVRGKTAFLKGQGGPKAQRDLTYLGDRHNKVRFFLYALPGEVRLSAGPVCGVALPAVPGTPGLEGDAADGLPTIASGELDDPPPPSEQLEMERTLYVYRAQNDAEYPPTNINAADIPGVLSYLQTTVVPHTPRRDGITRILRFKVTIRRTPQMMHSKHFFGPFMAFDYGGCHACNWGLEKWGNMPGCQQQAYAGSPIHWYSFPGPCPQQRLYNKTPECERLDSGGYCACGTQLGTANCNYHIEYAGEVRLDELVGIPDYDEFVLSGGDEYDGLLDAGTGVTFWDGRNDTERFRARVLAVEALFQSKHPDTPRTLGPQVC